MTKKMAEIHPGWKANSQVIDNIESEYSENSSGMKNLHFKTAGELVGAIKFQKRINIISETALLVELAKIQAAYKGRGDLALTLEADSFKEFVIEVAGLNYPTIMNKLTHLRTIGPRLLQMFEDLGVPVTLQRQIKRLPAKLRERLDSVLTESPIQNAEEVEEIFRELTAHAIALQDRLDEASIKTKVEALEERDRYKDHYELAEDRMINMKEQLEKERDKVKKLLASQNLDDKAIAIRKINDTLTIYFKALADADLGGDDLDLRTEKNRFLELMSRAHEIGLS